jgi:hypothetical protein
MTEEPGDKLLRYLESQGYFLSESEVPALRLIVIAECLAWMAKQEVVTA